MSTARGYVWVSSDIACSLSKWKYCLKHSKTKIIKQNESFCTFKILHEQWRWFQSAKSNNKKTPRLNSGITYICYFKNHSEKNNSKYPVALHASFSYLLKYYINSHNLIITSSLYITNLSYFLFIIYHQ